MSVKIITGKVRLSYLHVFEPKAMEEGMDPKYSASLIIPKDSPMVEKIEKAIAEAIALGKTSKWGGKTPRNLKLPLRDGDEERPDDPAYANSFFINANSQQAPGVVDRQLNAILDKDEMYSGCYGRASIVLYCFDVSGNKGVAAGLNNIQKLADGERLSGGASAEDDFGDVPVEDDDFGDML